MITDSQTNFLYLSGLLPIKFPKFFDELTFILKEYGIKYDLLPDTKDIWCRDYMPVQVNHNQFIRFVYDPSYLKFKKWAPSRTEPTTVCDAIKIPTVASNVVIDAGNIVRTANKVIMCDRVIDENPNVSEPELLKNIKTILQVDKLVIIPTQPGDILGHSDGLVRFYNDNTVLISNLSKEDKSFQRNFSMALYNAGLDTITIPYIYSNKTALDATSCYINFLQMRDIIIIPAFGLPEDAIALEQFQDLYPGIAVKQIDCGDIAKEGGVLNCISWTTCRNEE
jgi:agmatine deiminase